jgi:mono/diheme cytochrome c family protein
LATSSKKGITIARLQAAIANNTGGMGSLSSLTVNDVQALVTVLTPSTPTPTPTPTPVVDGATLYNSNCMACHGPLTSTSKAGATVSRIQTAISNNIGTMGSLATLSAAQITAIQTALATATPPPAPAPVPAPTPVPSPTPTPAIDGAALYGTSCAGCHGALAQSSKAGATATRIQTAINSNTGSMGSLASLTTAQVAALESALATVTPSPTPAPAPACGSCHAIPPATGHHSTHNSKSCSTCHGAGYSTTAFNPATHNNGVKNLDLAKTGWKVATRTCSNSCHGTKTW